MMWVEAARAGGCPESNERPRPRRLRQPGHPALAEQQPAGAAGAGGTQRRSSPAVTAVTAVADQPALAARPAVPLAEAGVEAIG